MAKYLACIAFAAYALPSLVEARPNFLGCNNIGSAWKVGNQVSGMNKPTIQAAGGSSGGCVISGVPSQYDGGVEYTIKVGCPGSDGGFSGGRGCAHLFSASEGAVGGASNPACGSQNGRSSNKVDHTWKAPDDDAGEVSFDALCAHYS
eukprot:gene20898-16965_t